MNERKLAVILHADVVGSTHLVIQDETLAHERIRDVFRRLSECIESHGGVTRELRGDALVAEFAKASDAIGAALTFQKDSSAHNQGLSDPIRPELRIGIAMGEVLIADETITGEGVVLAQRLEQLADPYGICVQSAVHDTVPKRLPFRFEDLGELELKGITGPVRVYRVSDSLASDGSVPDRQIDIDQEMKPGSEKPAIAILPFTNMSGDPEQVYFSDGITEDIITELSHFRELSVIARNSTFVYRDKAVDVIEIGRTLNVEYVLEGSIRKASDRVRVTAQLIDARSGNHIWADRYDRQLEDIFAVQDELVRIISSTMIGQVHQAGNERAKRMPPSSLKSYDCVMLGLSCFYKWTPEDNRRAMKYFEQAVTIDPSNAPAYAGLAEVHFREGLNAWSKSHYTSFDLLFQNAQKAVELDGNSSNTHTVLGVAYLFRGEHELAFSHFNRALSLNPSDTRAMVHMARCECLAGFPEKGAARIQQALHFNPLANYQWYAGQIHYISGDYQDAIACLSGISKPNMLVHAFLAASHAKSGDLESAGRSAEFFLDSARALVARSEAELPTSWVRFVTDRYPFRHQSDAMHLASGLKAAGIDC